MVTEYGMSAAIGSVKLGQGSGEVFLGRDMGHQRDYSEDLAEKIDAEVRVLIEQAHDEAWQVLNDNRDVLDRLAAELLEKETLDHNQIAEIFADVRKLPERPQWLSSEKRPLSQRPPIEFPVLTSPVNPGATDGGVESSAAPDSAPEPPRATNPRPATA
jgi:cell division protease FtsH